MINIESHGKNIILFGRNNKEPYIKIIKDFYPYFYVEDEFGEFKTIEGNYAKKIICEYPRDVKLKRQVYNRTYEADIIYTNRYIIDRVDKIEKEEVRICYLDIEIKRTEKGYESVEKATNPILSICCYDSFDKEYTMFHDTDEKKTLMEFISYIKDKDPDMLIAWNGDGFDFPFIINRINKIGLEAKNLARLGRDAYTTKYGAKIFGRICFDLMNAYKKHFSGGGRESWSLEYISKYELGDKGGKEEYRGQLDDLYKEDLEKFLRYNKRDVELLVLLNEELGIIDFFDEVRRLAFCKFEDVFMNSKTADCLCLKYAKDNGFILPSVRQHKESEKYKGGYVQESEPKLHYNIAVMDMKSLYPSIMIGFNTSYETLDKNGVINIDNKYIFREEKGIIPSIVRPLLDTREIVSRKMKEEKKKNGKSRKYRTLWITQFSLKVIANAFYGVMGFKNFRLYKKEVASAVTYIARKIIKEVGRWFEEKGYKVIYGDTDSVFVEMGESSMETMAKLNEEINEYFETYFKQFNVIDNIFKLEFEKIYKTLFFKRNAMGTGVKKKYAGRVIWEEGVSIDELNIVGFESRRSDNPQIGRDFIKDTLRKIVYEKPYEELKKDVDEFREKIRIGYYNAEELGLPIGLSKHPDKYGNQIHAKASRLANEKHKAQIRQGDKIKYIYIKGPEKVIAFKDYMWDGYEIDYDNMIRRIVDLKIGPLFESLGWDYEYTLIQKSKKIKELTYEEKLNQKELW